MFRRRQRAHKSRKRRRTHEKQPAPRIRKTLPSPLPFLPNWWGVVTSQLTTWIALGPSFLPRTWWMTAASVAFSQLYGYAVGASARTARNSVRGALRRRGILERPTEVRFPVLASAWKIFLLSSLTVGTAASLVSSMNRQREIARLVDEKPPTARTQVLGMTAGTAGTVAVLIAIRIFRWQSWGTRRLLTRFVPALAMPFSGTIVTALFSIFVNRSIVWARLQRQIRDAAEQNNLKHLPGRIPPKQIERSGSAASFEQFGTLGRHGKAVVSDGPRAKHIAAYWGEPALEPVRAYVGLRPTVSIEEAAKRAVRELKRAGGFNRDHICIYIGTGTGWLNDWSMAAMEFLTRGNCAMVSLQYTVLPSAFAVFLDRDSPQRTSQALYREVTAVLDQMPPAERPKLYMSGESLGAFGGLSEFENSSDMTDRLDGAIWAGTPQFSPIWQELTDRRSRGSTVILPQIDDGSTIRFSNKLGDLARPGNRRWGDHRFAFLQHPSDPIVWWSTSLMWREPEWMTEPRGHDVSQHLSWWPWVTFWQIASDMPMSIQTKGGHAHRYYEEYVEAWSQVLGIDADVPGLIEAIRPHIHLH